MAVQLNILQLLRPSQQENSIIDFVSEQKGLSAKNREGDILKILIAESGPDILRLYRSLLEDSGHEIFTVTNGNECSRVYKTALASNKMDSTVPFNLVMMNDRLPEKNGFELAKEILSLCPNQPILMMTFYVEQDNLKDEGLRKIQVIEKPFDIDELLRVISNIDVKAKQPCRT